MVVIVNSRLGCLTMPVLLGYLAASDLWARTFLRKIAKNKFTRLFCPIKHGKIQARQYFYCTVYLEYRSYGIGVRFSVISRFLMFRVEVCTLWTKGP